MKRNPIFFIVILAILAQLVCTTKDAKMSKENLNLFFQSYENGEYSTAISIVPLQLRDLTPYEKGKENLTPYERDKEIYYKLMEYEAGSKKESLKTDGDQNIHYYLGVMHYRMNNLELARNKFLKCLQIDPSYRMAHIYLFRVFRRLESKVLQNLDEKTESIGTQLIEKLGFGNSDLHFDLASKLLGLREKSEIKVLSISFTYDNSVIKDFKSESSLKIFQKNRGNYVWEGERKGLNRIELIDKDRYCLDETFFPSEMEIYWDSVDESGKMVGGKKVKTTFPLYIDLVMPKIADKVIIYDPQGKKVFEHSLNP